MEFAYLFLIIVENMMLLELVPLATKDSQLLMENVLLMNHKDQLTLDARPGTGTTKSVLNALLDGFISNTFSINN